MWRHPDIWILHILVAFLISLIQCNGQHAKVWEQNHHFFRRSMNIFWPADHRKAYHRQTAPGPESPCRTPPASMRSQTGPATATLWHSVLTSRRSARYVRRTVTGERLHNGITIRASFAHWKCKHTTRLVTISFRTRRTFASGKIERCYTGARGDI